ncbi:TPA: hypothetical protein ACKQCE_001672 [Serratia marcescens]
MSRKKTSYLDKLELNKMTRANIMVYIFALILGATLIVLAKILAFPYQWLYINPSYMNNTSLSWISSSWASVLGIHGTIAALSITFMGMFVSQVASSVENSFESVCRIILLRKKNFLNFSMDAVCGLILGVFFMVVGGGLIHYSISMAISIYFIITYMIMYYELYSVTEDKNAINEILFDELKYHGNSYHESKIESERINNNFKKLIDTKVNILTDSKYDYITEDITQLNIFPKSNSLVIDSYHESNLDDLDSYLTSIDKNIRLYLRISFLYPTINYDTYLTTKKGIRLTEAEIDELSIKVNQCFNIRDKNVTYESFKMLESSVVENIYHTLITGNERSLDFGALALSLLSSKSNHIEIIKHLDHLVTSSGRNNHIEISILEAFFEKLYHIKLGEGTIKDDIFVISSIIDMSMYIYEKDKYETFFKKVNRFISHRTKYGDDKINNPCLEYYIALTIRHISNMYYKAFEENTCYLANDLKYLSKTRMDKKLNDRQKKLISCMRECIALLTVRFDFLMSKDSNENYKIELEKIASLINQWSNPSFMEEIYFLQETYDTLFSIPSDFSSIRAEMSLRETPDGVATWVGVNHSFYKAIAILLYQFPMNKNHLSLIFISDKNQFLQNTKLTTQMIGSIVDYVRTSDFLLIINTIGEHKESDENIQVKTEKLADSLEKMKSEITTIITKEIEHAELDMALISQYQNEIKDRAIEKISEFLNIDNAEKTMKVKGNVDYCSLIDKREVLPSIDGVHFSMNTENHAISAVFSLIRKSLNYINNDNVVIETIHDTDRLENNNYITIEYMVKDRVNTYKFSKGLRMYDNDGYLGFEKSGMYYLNLDKELDVKLNPDELVSTKITSINNKNIDGLYEKFALNKDDENLLLRSEIEITFNIFINRKESTTLLFLSEEKCKELNEKEERQYQQLIRTNRDSIDNTLQSQ